MADVFQLLAEPSRRHLLEALRDGERSVNDLVARTHMSQPSVSKQLRILRDSGVVALRPVGRQHLYSIQGRSLREASEWLSYYERFWQEGLNRMDEALRREPGPKARRKR
ncbi:MAG: metalloregulator ArsR/SmtB family transcription factor [Candidatus Thermoplasmatota archaeon]|jgi:DNA-binding transcriptional ArsR family regulator|nr:metalloregulator ArsR/SmtB family transcription factor [Candidatus Thermoplasmatota archaeon]MCL5983902.1 metalloregulator ArsR/SmtB family transcription factor [Candidatus Thermoplasmatota archaeon]